MTVVNALSDYFMLESLREVEKTDHIIEFEDGKLKTDKKKSNQSGKHGTKVKFKSNPKYIGENCSLPVEDMIKWVETVFCLDSEKLNKKGISCKFLVYDGMTLKETHKIKPSPFKSLIDKILPEGYGKRDFSSQMMISADKEFVEKSKTLVEKKDGTKIVEIVPMQKHIHMDVCLQYAVNPELNDPATYDTYCNYTNTIKNGVHLKAFEEAFCRFMYASVNETMSDSQKDKMKITWDDIRNNLYCVINLSSNAAVGFVGNAKEEIGNEALIPYMKELLNKRIKKFFDENPSVLNEYIKIIKLNAKARIEANKIKTASQTERLNTFKEHKHLVLYKPL